MSKMLLQLESVATAKNWADALVRRESRGTGDTENAMHRLETRYGIPWRVFWSLRYRPPKDMLVSVFCQLRAAYFSECERQQALLQHEITVARAKSVFVEDIMVEMDSLVAHDMVD